MIPIKITGQTSFLNKSATRSVVFFVKLFSILLASALAYSLPPIRFKMIRASSFLFLPISQRGLSATKNKPAKNSNEGIDWEENIQRQLFSPALSNK